MNIIRDRLFFSSSDLNSRFHHYLSLFNALFWNFLVLIGLCNILKYDDTKLNLAEQLKSKTKTLVCSLHQRY